MYLYYLILILVNSVQSNSLDYVKDLSELPMEKLLHVKNSLREFSNDVNEVADTEPAGDSNSPQALPLKNDKNKYPIRREGYGDEWLKDNKGGKIKSIFQLSVTTLAFLAFGGYLLCMIVQAIKNKGTFMSTSISQPMMMVPTASASASAALIKKKPLGRRRRYAANKGNNTEKAPKMLANENDMYKALILLAEGFAEYNDAI